MNRFIGENYWWIIPVGMLGPALAWWFWKPIYRRVCPWKNKDLSQRTTFNGPDVVACSFCGLLRQRNDRNIFWAGGAAYCTEEEFDKSLSESVDPELEKLKLKYPNVYADMTPESARSKVKEIMIAEQEAHPGYDCGGTCVVHRTFNTGPSQQVKRKFIEMEKREGEHP